MTINIATHKNILVDILSDIFKDPVLSQCLAFKGGTAALLFYELTRFSVDLDFDLLDEVKQEYIFETINNILQKHGTVKAQNKRYSIFFLLSYNDKIVGAENIKLEVNKRSFGSRYEIKHYLSIPMKVMIQEDMAAHKLVAMHERMGNANRDIFDVWFFLKNHWPINKKIVEQRTNTTYKDFLKVCIKQLEQIGDKGILAGLGELLTEKQKTWVKTNLRSEVIFLLKRALTNEQ